MSPVHMSTLLMLLLVTSFSGATQVFPQSYEFTQLSAFSEPEATCPDVAVRNRERFTVCYYDNEIRPKLMDCDLGEGTYQDGGAYPLLYSGPTDRKIYEFMFTFDLPLILSSFTLHYYCSLSSLFSVTHDLRTDQSSQRTIVCGTGHQNESFTGSETPNQNVTVTFTIPAGFREGGGIFLSEVQFFSGADSVPADPCTDRSCCAHETVCHVSSTAPNGYECECPDGFSGVNCQFRSCTTLPCQNGGTCTDILGDYSCACPPGYTGKQCGVMLTTSTTEAMPSPVAVTSSVLASQLSDQSGSSSSSATAAAAAGAVVSVFLVILIISGFVAVVVYWRRKKGKKSRKVIEHIGEDESNIYALVAKSRKKRNAPPTVPLWNFDPVEEGLDIMETPSPVLSDPSTGHASTSPLVYADNKCFNCVDSEEQSPPSHPLTGPNTYDTVDANKRTPEDPCYSVPDTNGHVPPPAYGADSGNVNEDTVSAANSNAVLQNSVLVGNDDFEVDTDMYAIVNYNFNPQTN